MRKLVCGLVALALVVPGAGALAGEAGFVEIFNGKDLTGWDGNPNFWSVKDGAIHGETTKEKPTRGNTFCIWRGGKLKDFILELDFRIHNGNSGIQYRSLDLGNWVVSGYQAEVCNQKGKVGFLYHEKGRGYLCRVGQKVVIEKNGKRKVEKFGDPIVHYLNGVKTIDFTDNQLDDPNNPKPDRRKGRLEGILALQIHAGPPMWVEFKNIKVKHLK